MTQPYYQQDGITIYHGDCLEVMPTLSSSSTDLVLADQPYMIGAVSVGDPKAKCGTWADMMNSGFWFAEWYRCARRLLKSTGHLATFGNWRSMPTLIYGMARCDMQATNCIVWDKEWIGPSGPNALRPIWELILTSAMPDAKVIDRSAADVMRCKWMASQLGTTGHPAEKPVSLLSRLISIYAPELGSTVLDPFMGSGSSLQAAFSLGHRYIGIESEERWCEIAANRLAQGVLFGTGGAA